MRCSTRRRRASAPWHTGFPWSRTRRLGLRGRHTVLVWCRDRQNTWQTELAEGKPPERLHEVRINLGSENLPSAGGTVQTYDPWTDAWHNAAPAGATIVLPDFSRSLVVRVKR